MKKIILLLFLITSLLFAQMPKEIKNQIAQQARETYDDNNDARSFIDWQESSYNQMEKTLAQADIPEENKEQIRFYLRGRYGINFIKQNSVVAEEINKIKNSEQNIRIATDREIERILGEKKLEELEVERNQKSKKELELIEKSLAVPLTLMSRFKSEAERLYPENYYEQKRYIESSIGNYEFYKNSK